MSCIHCEFFTLLEDTYYTLLYERDHHCFLFASVFMGSTGLKSWGVDYGNNRLLISTGSKVQYDLWEKEQDNRTPSYPGVCKIHCRVLLYKAPVKRNRCCVSDTFKNSVNHRYLWVYILKMINNTYT